MSDPTDATDAAMPARPPTPRVKRAGVVGGPPGSGGVAWLRLGAWLAACAVVAPIVSVGVSAGLGAGSALGTWAHLADTVLAETLLNTLALCMGVGGGVAALGVGAAWLITRYEFPGRSVFEWALVLPLAMPAYVAAYTYTDALQFVGPVQTWLRQTFGWTRADYWFPEVRSLGGAVAMFVGVLYPYVYMLARTAFLERAGGLLEVARSMGLSPWQGFVRVSLPLARPAIAAGVALALMEALADYGTVSYFAVQTFTTGIYRAWFSLGDRAAAAQLALVLLAFVGLVLAAERGLRGRARFDDASLRRSGASRVPLRGLHAALATAASALPLVLGFLLPAGLLLRMAWVEGDAQFGERFLLLARHSVTLAGATALLAVGLALLIGYAARVHRGSGMRWVHRASGLGYALPGSVIAVGVLIPVTRVDHALAAAARGVFGVEVGLVFTGTIAALVYACLVRYLSAAVQTVDAGLARITPQMDQAARSLGHSPAQTLARVHLPLLRGSLLTAALLVFIDVMKELPATLVMRPFNFDTLATQTFVLASDERLAEASTAALAIVAVGLAPLVLLCRQIARGQRVSVT